MPVCEALPWCYAAAGLMERETADDPRQLCRERRLLRGCCPDAAADVVPLRGDHRGYGGGRSHGSSLNAIARASAARTAGQGGGDNAPRVPLRGPAGHRIYGYPPSGGRDLAAGGFPAGT